MLQSKQNTILESFWKLIHYFPTKMGINVSSVKISVAAVYMW